MFLEGKLTQAHRDATQQAGVLEWQLGDAEKALSDAIRRPFLTCYTSGTPRSRQSNANENGPDRYPTLRPARGLAWFDSTVGLAFGSVKIFKSDGKLCALLPLSAMRHNA